MSKKKNKTEDEILQNIVLYMLKNNHGLGNPCSVEEPEAIKNDQYRQEAYAKVEEWVLPYLQKKVREICEENERLLKKYEKKIFQSQKELSAARLERQKVVAENRHIKRKLNEIERDVKELKKLTRLVFSSAGVCNSQASLKAIRKKVGKIIEKNGTKSDKYIDVMWKER